MTESTWRFIPADAYVEPAEPAPEAVRSGVLDLWRRLRRAPASAEPG